MYENCFAYRNEKGCVALNEMLCKTKGKCSFYKPKNHRKPSVKIRILATLNYVSIKNSIYYYYGYVCNSVFHFRISFRRSLSCSFGE